ncbi:MAG: hypothetical protein COZ18_07670 [Flexibacter sp. CG_4_10_14_3_um_filter_32_15]|nr:MAG: hypothetical protein COZ18_07670 [Flexibacter sp. CG_4_10_14_3_um_filter_32_15]
MNRLFSLSPINQKIIVPVFFCVFCLFISGSSFGQDTKIDSLTIQKVDSVSQIIIKETVKDSTKIAKKLDVELEPKFKLRPPARAALLSAVLPGAGQYYNKKAWAIKVPAIYALLAVPAYLSINNHANYRIYRENYLYLKDENPATKPDPSFETRSADQVQRQRDSYRRDRDFYMIITGLFYLLNIGEATTTAHFNNFDIDDDISFKFKPQMESVGTNGNTLGGVSLVMTF